MEPGCLPVKVRGIPHLAKNERDAPNFLYAALDRTACAPFFKERRMKFREPTKLHRKSGMWGTHVRGQARSLLFEFSHTHPTAGSLELIDPQHGASLNGGESEPDSAAFRFAGND